MGSHNSTVIENTVESMQKSMQSMQSMQNMQNMQSMQSMPSMQSMQNMQNMQSMQSTHVEGGYHMNQSEGQMKLVCHDCRRTFAKKERLHYHLIMCTREKKEEIISVKNFFGINSDDDDDDDNNMELLFFSAKNLEKNSREEIIDGLEKRLGVKVTEFKGKEKMRGRSNKKMKKKIIERNEEGVQESES